MAGARYYSFWWFTSRKSRAAVLPQVSELREGSRCKATAISCDNSTSFREKQQRVWISTGLRGLFACPFLAHCTKGLQEKENFSQLLYGSLIVKVLPAVKRQPLPHTFGPSMPRAGGQQCSAYVWCRTVAALLHESSELSQSCGGADLRRTHA